MYWEISICEIAFTEGICYATREVANKVENANAQPVEISRRIEILSIFKSERLFF